jgi:hypothetical protein
MWTGTTPQRPPPPGQARAARACPQAARARHSRAVVLHEGCAARGAAANRAPRSEAGRWLRGGLTHTPRATPRRWPRRWCTAERCRASPHLRGPRRSGAPQPRCCRRRSSCLRDWRCRRRTAARRAARARARARVHCTPKPASALAPRPLSSVAHASRVARGCVARRAPRRLARLRLPRALRRRVHPRAGHVRALAAPAAEPGFVRGRCAIGPTRTGEGSPAVAALCTSARHQLPPSSSCKTPGQPTTACVLLDARRWWRRRAAGVRHAAARRRRARCAAVHRAGATTIVFEHRHADAHRRQRTHA